MTQQKSKFLAVVAAAVMTIGSSHASLILVDLNDAGTDPGATWNTIAAPTGTTALKDTSGSFASGISLSFVNESTVDPSNENNIFQDSGTGSQAGAFSSTAFSAAAEDYFWGNNAATGTIVLSNVADGSYKIELVSSRSTGIFANPSRLADFTVNGAFADSLHNGNDFDSHRDGFDNGSLLVWNNVEITEGVITIQVAIEAKSTLHPYAGTADVHGDYSNNGGQDKTTHINAFSVTTIPEPSTFALTITPAVSGYDLTWKSQVGMLYTVWSTADLSEALMDGTLVEGNIAASGTDSNTKNVNPAETVLFYRVEEFPAP
jgi:hypothetical protein